MPKKYHIDFKTTPPRFTPVGKAGIIDFTENCTRCHPCAKKACIYNVYQERRFDSRQMADSIDYLCKNCFRCVQQCKKGLLSKSVNPEYLNMGNAYWTPEIILTNWNQAETGKIPVSGAGYRGPFTGKGFDSMWTDMSEIVRPTRDGIHGREYINTSVDIGRKLSMLKFTEAGKLTSVPSLLEIPLPMFLSYPLFGYVNESVMLAMALAAAKLGTFFIVKVEDYHESLDPYRQFIIPQGSSEALQGFQDKVIGHKAIEVLYSEDVLEFCKKIKSWDPNILISIKVPFDGSAVAIVEKLTSEGVEVIHLFADENGNAIGNDGSHFIKDMILEVHLRLVERSLRDEVTLIASGGIAMAEHVAKAIICGVDAVVLDTALLLALECRLCKYCEKERACPVAIDQIEPRWGSQRIINMAGAWRNQLLEVLGAMGIREVRRLRGEVGRAMFFEAMEQEIFGQMFGERA
jgi:ferredoxin